jgi:uncharacterized protein (TIGR00661 family)
MDQATTILKSNILIAPLDWGLGHATRCIPVINALIQKNCNVLIACEGKTRALLHNEFPHLSFVDLRGYRISYARSKWALTFSIGVQIPKILSTIQYENERLKQIVKEHDIHGVISDNRYGFYHDTLPSVFLTHQLRIKTPLGRLADDYLQKLNYRHINRFTQCWVPDSPATQNLGGELSHPERTPAVPIRYVGVLSRFQGPAENGKDLLVLLSGPEPQRTVFERLLIRQLAGYNGSVTLVRGLPGDVDLLQVSPNITVYNHLASQELNIIMNQAALVVSRCGFSTVMDLAILKKKSILVPTPGQTEQEYLAKHLMRSNFALCIDQDKFSLKPALELSHRFPYQLESFAPGDRLNSSLDDFLALTRTP